MTLYKCPKCGRKQVLPEGHYYCKRCGPEVIMEKKFGLEDATAELMKLADEFGMAIEKCERLTTYKETLMCAEKKASYYLKKLKDLYKSARKMLTPDEREIFAEKVSSVADAIMATLSTIKLRIFDEVLKGFVKD